MEPPDQVNAWPDPAALRGLRRAAWGVPEDESDWSGVLVRGLCWVTASDGERLVGFVNVAWDGGVHAFVLDTTVHPEYQRRGVGRELLRRASLEARARGAHRLHVDYEPPLEAFYRACGFGPTRAGLMRL